MAMEEGLVEEGLGRIVGRGLESGKEAEMGLESGIDRLDG